MCDTDESKERLEREAVWWLTAAMQPKFLSLELIMLGSAALLVIIIVPAVCFCAWKLRAGWRVVATGVAVVSLSVYFFWLGQAVGRSKAWYHWRSEYQYPLENMQIHLNELASENSTDALKQFCTRFGKENIQAYGREELFHQSRFNEFVTIETGAGPLFGKERRP